MALHLNKQTFDEVISGDKPVLVDFWATWCGPCRMIAPAVEEVAEDFAGRAVVGKVDVDEQRELAIQYRVMSVPTVIFLKDGKEVDRKIGVREPAEYTERLDACL